MSLSKTDYKEAQERVEAGEGTDDDLRIVKWWPRWHGSSTENSSETTPSSGGTSRRRNRSTARTTEPLSSQPPADDSTVLSTDGRGQSDASSGDSE